MADFYGEDLAYVHHKGFSGFAEGAGSELLRILREAGIVEGRVVDLGCGGGRWARALIKAGYDVFGVDLSPSMIELARKTAPKGEFQVGSAFEVSIDSCVAVTALGEVLNYRHGGIPSETALGALFERIARKLSPGGIFAFDIIAQFDEAPMQYRSWQKGEDWAVLVEVNEYREKNTLRREITVFRRVERDFRRSDESHEVDIHDAAAVQELLQRVGFDVQVTPAYGSHPLAARRLAFIATKRPE